MNKEQFMECFDSFIDWLVVQPDAKSTDQHPTPSSDADGPFRLERGDWGTRVVTDEGTIIIAAARNMSPVRDAANAAANRWAKKYKQEHDAAETWLAKKYKQERDVARAECKRLKMELARFQESMSTADLAEVYEPERGRVKGGDGEYVVVYPGTKVFGKLLGVSKAVEYAKEVAHEHDGEFWVARITHIVRPGPATVEEV